MAVPLSAYKVPGVKVQEIRKLPASIAQVDTAVPVFIGRTQRAIGPTGESLTNQTREIFSLNEYERLYGSSITFPFEVGMDFDPGIQAFRTKVQAKPADKQHYLMYYAMQMYFQNGGGRCYVISTGAMDAAVSIDEYDEVFNLLKVELNPSLLVFPDSVANLDVGDHGALMSLALGHCNHKNINNSFVIMDVPQTEVADISQEATDFRGAISGSVDEMKYGAAYYPFLKSTIGYEISDEEIKFTDKLKVNGKATDKLDAYSQAKQDFEAAEKASKKAAGELKQAEQELADANSGGDQATISTATNKKNTAVKTVSDAATKQGSTKSAYDTALDAAKKEYEMSKEMLDFVTDQLAAQAKNVAIAKDTKLSDLKEKDNATYNRILNEVRQSGRVNMPPSSAMAGVYATVDSTRGVHKAPANVGIKAMTGLTRHMSEERQADFNVDTQGGKSINVIRTLIGTGTLVWGGRTLAGNDNEWRYVNVRRTFNMVEESVKRALVGYVFEPNNQNTWKAIRSGISNFLDGQWRAGALFGATAEDSYFVRVGMPETFTEDEMNNGFLVVEIGMAVVRPAEFIVLKFMHKMQNE